MFGYVRPLRGELKVREWEAYRAAYCGLCHTLGRRYGFPARMTLNYDFTFLVMLLGHSEEKPCFRAGRCPIHPTRKRPMCATGPGMELAADESVILTWWKLRDNLRDSGFWKGLAARLGLVFLKGAYRKAARLRPDFDRAVARCLDELTELEENGSPSLDRTADTFARILKAAAPASGDEHADRALEQLLYHLGRWIYLVDAVDDLEEDRAAGRYNPVLARFEGEPDREYLRTTLRHSRSLACSACQLVDFGTWNEVVKNVLYLGLPAVEELVFTGEWKQQQKIFGRTSE